MPLAIRSGRFKVADAQAGVTIIAGKKGAFYRIFNSGKLAFKVDVGNAEIVLAAASSVDLAASVINGIVMIKTDGEQAAEGIYDFIGSPDSASDYLVSPDSTRSGRVNVEQYASAITIIKDRSGAFYRIFNSGSNKFTVKPEGNDNRKVELWPKWSLDVAVGGEVVVEGDPGKSVEGIYECLETRNPVRSGRINIVKTEGAKGKLEVDPAAQHKIIDLHGGGDRAWYRIYNSGKHPILLDEGWQAAKPLKTLEEGQSFDFEVGRSITDIYVRSESSEQPIEGIYEFLGRGD
jgi:hypothetical protein